MAKGKYEYWLSEDGLLLLRDWARDGRYTDEQIAKKMGIAYSTLRDWRDKYPAISAALKRGKEVVDITVVDSLYEKTQGITRIIKKPFKLKRAEYENGKKVLEEEFIEYADEEVYYPPDVTSIIFWLKKRLREIWGDEPNKPDNEGGSGIIVLPEVEIEEMTEEE